MDKTDPVGWDWSWMIVATFAAWALGTFVLVLFVSGNHAAKILSYLWIGYIISMVAMLALAAVHAQAGRAPLATGCLLGSALAFIGVFAGTGWFAR